MQEYTSVPSKMIVFRGGLAFEQHGPNMKPPINHEVRVPLPRKEVEHTITIYVSIYIYNRVEAIIKKFGCSLKFDSWTVGL